jgi:thioredoxin-like negative regulator of GroEL
MWTEGPEEAVSAYKRVIQLAPDHIYAHVMLAATYSMMGREEEACAQVAEVVRINRRFSLDFYAKTAVFKDRTMVDNIDSALRKAGLK